MLNRGSLMSGNKALHTDVYDFQNQGQLGWTITGD
jgi:hypothetical protein